MNYRDELAAARAAADQAAAVILDYIRGSRPSPMHRPRSRRPPIANPKTSSFDRCGPHFRATHFGRKNPRQLSPKPPIRRNAALDH